MKTVREPFRAGRHWEVRTAVSLFLATFLGATAAAEVQSTGYLSKTGPPGLRFSAPPKPPVLSLGPQPSSYTPPPALVTEFVTPTNALPGIRSNVLSPPINASSLQTSGTARAESTNQAKAGENFAQSHVINLQALVKYFAEKKNTSREQLPLAEPVGFRVPVRETNSHRSVTQPSK